MLRILFFISIYLILTANALYSQSLPCKNCLDEESYKSKTPVPAVKYYNEFPALKEQFYNNWLKGRIIYENNRITDSCMLRYNGWNDEIIWLRETDYKQGIVIKDRVKEFYLYPENAKTTTKHFVKVSGTSIMQPQNIYLEVLNEGNIQLLCHRKMSYLKANNIFTYKHQYYLWKDGEMHKIKLNKASIFDYLDEQNKANIKKILRENHLNIKKEKDAVRLFILLKTQQDK